MTDQETIGALTQAIGAAEAGRRVGWARAYSAEASKDELSRDVNMLRMERDIMRRAASFMLGFMRVYLQKRGDTTAAKQALARWSQDVERVMDDDAVRAGREAAEAVVALDSTLVADREKRAAEKKQRQAQHGREFKAARLQERRLLTQRYGFPNEAALLNYLELYRREGPGA